MIYTIEEKNLERQHLLAQWLDPLSRHALERISLRKGSKILDVGCGLGDTTLMLSKCFEDTRLTGLDQDMELIEEAKAANQAGHSTMQFVTGDAQQLPFPDNSFDFAFTRYLLHHVPDGLTALKEMKRVCKSGGIVFAQVPDINFMQSYPESWAYPQLKEFMNLLFKDPLIGRKLLGYYKSLQLENIQYDVRVILAGGDSVIKRFYSMTAEALSKTLLKNNLIEEKRLDEWIKELIRIEQDEDTIVLLYPIISVWAAKK